MKFEGVKVYDEILPYFGTLDEVFVLMTSANKKTKNDWEEHKHIISQKIKKRKKTTFIAGLKKKYDTYSRKEKLIIDLFQLPSVHLYNQATYEKFISFTESLPDDNMCVFDKIYLGNGNHKRVTKEVFDEESLKNDSLLDIYEQLLEVLRKKRLDMYIESYLQLNCLGERPLSYIKTIVINFNNIGLVLNFKGYMDILRANKVFIYDQFLII